MLDVEVYAMSTSGRCRWYERDLALLFVLSCNAAMSCQRSDSAFAIAWDTDQSTLQVCVWSLSYWRPCRMHQPAQD